MAYPFDDYDPAYIQNQPIPPLPPEERPGLLKKLGDEALGGLGWIGHALDKTFGGRALRGLLGGKPEELLSVLPFSDTWELTDPANIVTGKQLLGIQSDPSEGFGWNDIQGIGAEIALDPAMWVGAAIPKLVFGGLNKGARAIGSGLEAVTAGKFNPYTAAGKGLEKVGRVGNALFDPSTQGAWGKTGQTIAQDVFTPELKLGQQAAKEANQSILSQFDDIVKAGGFPRGTPEYQARQAALLRGSLQAGEGFLPEARASLAAAGYDPASIDTIIDQAAKEAERVRRSTLLGEREVGVLSKEASDIPEWQRIAQEQARLAGEAVPFQNIQRAKYVPSSLADIPGEAAVARRQREGLSGLSEFQAKREGAFAGIPGGRVGINDLVRDVTMGPARVNDLVVEDKISKLLTGHSPGQVPAQWQGTSWGEEAWKGAQAQVKDLSRRLKAYPDAARQTGLFSEDLLGNLKSRELESARTKASGNAIVAGLTRPELGAVRPISQLEAAGERYVRVPEFLNQTGLTHVDDLGRPVAAAKVAEALGLDTKVVSEINKNLNGYGIPLDVAQDMLRIGQAWKVPSSLQPVVNAWDKVLQSFKDFVTFPFPAFTVRNLGTGLFDQWRGGALSLTAQKDIMAMQRGGSLSAETAAKLYPGLPVDQATKQLRNELMAADIAFVRGGVAGEKIGTQEKTIRRNLLPGELPTVAGEKRPLVQDIQSWLGSNKPSISKGGLNPLNSEDFFLVKGGRQLTNATEDFIRGSHYLALREKGMTPAAAKLETLKYQRDYSELTQFEQNVMKRLFPWYGFTRRNLPPLLQDLAKNPAKLSASVRVATSKPDEGFVPPWLAEGVALPLGEAVPGQDRFVAGLGLPFEDEAVKAIGNLGSGNFRRAAQAGLGMANPLIKYPLEESFGIQAHTGRRLDDLRPSAAAQEAGAIAEGAGLGQIDTRFWSQLLGASPASRFVSTAGKLIDERKDTPEKLLNLLTGAHVTDVDATKARQIAVRDYIERKLRGDQAVTNWEKFYVPPEKAHLLDPAELQLYRLHKALEQEARKKAKENRANQATR